MHLYPAADGKDVGDGVQPHPDPKGPSADPHTRLGHVLKHTEAKTTLKTKQHQK